MPSGFGFGEGTVRGTFELNTTQAVRSANNLRDAYRDADSWARRLGESGDRIGTAAQTTKLRTYRTEIKGLRTDMKKAADEAERLDIALGSLGRKSATPTVDMRGIDKALAKVELLHDRIDALSRQRATPRVGIGGGGGGGSRRGGGGRAGGGRVGSVNLPGFNVPGGSLRTIGTAAAAALPIVQALAGAVTALGSSLVFAAGGAGAIGAGGVGSLAVGLGSLVAVAKPAISRITDAYKAQTQFNQAQQDQLGIAKQTQAASDAVAQSQKRLIDAQKQAKYAQEDLTQARRDARRELVDMALAQDRGRLSEQRARLSLQQARQEQAQLALNPTATGLQKADARLSVSEAKLGLREARVTSGRATADNRRAQRGGVAGTQTVIGATRARDSANEAVADAKTGLKQATTEMAAGASAIATAKQQLDQAFARAPKGTRQLIADIRTLRGLWGADDTAKGRGDVDPSVAAAQNGLVRLASRGVGTLKQLTPTIGRAGLKSTNALNREYGGFSKFLTGSRTKNFVNTASSEFDENLGPVRRAAQYVAETFENITIASRPFLREATDFVEGWTKGWATSTRDVDKTQGFIGRMVSDLKQWKNLTGAAGHLAFDVATNAEGAGRGGVAGITAQLGKWDAWVKTNPKQVQAFFTNTVKSAGKLADAIIAITKALSHLATQLSPVLGNFTTLVSLAGSIGLLAPGAGAAAFGAYRGLRGGAGAAGAATGGRFSGAGLTGAAAGAAGAYGYAGRAKALYGTTRALGAGRAASALGAAPALLGGGARVAGLAAARAYLPVALGLGALNAYGLQGRGAAQRGQAFLSSVSLGNIPMPQSGAQISDSVNRYVGRFTGGLSNGTSAKGLQSDIRKIKQGQGLVRGTDFDFGSGDEREKNIADAQKQFKSALDQRVQMLKDFRKSRDEILSETSKSNADRFLGEYQEGFTRKAKRSGAPAAFKSTVSGSLKQLGGFKQRSGAVEFAQGTLDWARQQAAANPKLQGEYDRLASGIEKRLSKLGRSVSVVQGQILDGTSKQWGDIADEMSSQARRGVSDTSKEYTRLHAIALGALGQMGYSKSEASAILKSSRLRSKAGALTGSGQPALQSDANKARAHGISALGSRTGDGTGSGNASKGAPAGRSSGGSGLMGANAGLEGYASIGKQYGLSVTSGLRPGAITASGNRSLHADGWAIDESGSQADMLRYARFMATNYGAGLDELIHTPLGYGIKNGKKVPLSFWGQTINAEHNNHVHVGDRTPTGAGRGAIGGVVGKPGTGKAGTITARASSLPGTVGALSTAAGAAYASVLQQRVQAAGGGAAGGGLNPSDFSGGGTPTANQILGRKMMLADGWGSDQWPALKSLWTGESNWSEKAYNKSSGATGIPQSLPGSKMASKGADWKTNPRTQIAWGLDYIKGRYGSPSAAYSQWLARSPHWYGKGGEGLYRGATMIGVGDGQPSGGYEKVTVSRERPSTRGKGRGGVSQVHLHFDLRGATITSEAHARELIGKAADHAAKKLLDVLEDAVSDKDLVG